MGGQTNGLLPREGASSPATNSISLYQYIMHDHMQKKLVLALTKQEVANAHIWAQLHIVILPLAYSPSHITHTRTHAHDVGIHKAE